jgi:hypothetical protein
MAISGTGALLGAIGADSDVLLLSLALTGASYTAGALSWWREVRTRVVVTEEADALFGRLVALAKEVEELEPCDARDHLLEAVVVVADGLVSAGIELKAAGEGSTAEVAAHHEAAAAVVDELFSARDDLRTAQATRREAFALRSDLSATAGTLAALKATSSGAREVAGAAKDIESAAIAELLETTGGVSGTQVRSPHSTSSPELGAAQD